MSFAAAPPGLDATPLGALPAVVLDTETTGLDTSRDRIVEIGAVRLDPGRIGPADAFEQLVRPDVSIPATATSIHGISDDDVADAPPFDQAMAALSAWTGASVVVGYSVGFDLAMLQQEHRRHALPWTAPRTLDVRHLIAVLTPNLPDDSLDTAAGWLGIEVTDRHRALADARATAEVFRTLVPRLRDRGIVTLAEAERACRSLTARAEQEAAAGWTTGATGAEAAFTRIDSFPYRHRVGDLMASPPLSIAGDASLREAIGMMTESKVSSLVFQPTEAEGRFGIVTERDVLRALVGQDETAVLAAAVEDVGSSPLVSIDAGEYVYRAMAKMASGGFRHLGVTDTQGKLVGVLSARDLLKQRAQEAISVGDCLDAASTSDELGAVWSTLTTVVRALVEEDVDVRDIAAIISRELRALTHRACEFASDAATKALDAPPPAPFDVLVLGSGGRGESLLAMDQDNAVIHADTERAADPDRWFNAFGARLCDILDGAGVSYCPGGVMACNSAWRKSLTDWRETVAGWMGRSRPEDILNADIFFDGVVVYGETGLADTLRREAIEAARHARPFLRFLALNAAKVDPPIGWFGQFRSEGGRVDLKIGGIMPIFSAARVLALQHGFDLRTTPERLRAAGDAGIGTSAAISDLIEAHRILMDLILRQQLRDIPRGIPLSNRVAPAELSGLQRQQLKWALQRVEDLPGLLGTPLLG